MLARVYKPVILSTMNAQKSGKLNRLLAALGDTRLVSSRWLRAHGYSNSLVARYVGSGVRIVADGHVEGRWQQNAFSDLKTVRVEPGRALSMSLEEHSTHWAQARSPHLVSDASAVERTAQQQRGIVSLSPADQKMFARIRQDMPGHIGDDKVMRALHDARRADISGADKIGQVMIAGDRICIAGTISGFRSMTEVAQNTPPLHETVEQVQSLNQQRDHQMAMEQLQRNQDVPDGRGGPIMG